MDSEIQTLTSQTETAEDIKLVIFLNVKSTLYNVLR